MADERPPLDFATPDKHGLTPNFDKLTRNYRHRRGGRYTIVGFAYDAANDEWQYRYMSLDSGSVEFTRSFHNFHQTDGEGVARFVED